MKIKQSKQKRNRLAKITNAESLRDKIFLARTGMADKEYNALTMVLARDFFKLRHVDPKELDERVRREVKKGDISERTESEFNSMVSAQKRACQFVWVAMHKWKPELLEELARAMRRHARHRFPQASDALRRGALIANHGKVSAALHVIEAWNPNCNLETEKRNLTRLKRRFFSRDT